MEEKANGLIAKWGNELFDDGITNLPECVARYGNRFVTAGELVFAINILSYRYGSDLPFPSQDTIAHNMGVGVRQIRKWQKGLEDKEMVIVYERYNEKGRTSNIYDFSPLVNLCLEASKQEKAANEKIVKVVRKKSKKEVPDQKGPISEWELKGPIPPESKGPLPQEPKGPNPPELKGPMNKEKEKSNLKKKKKNVCIEEQRILDLIENREDLKTHTQTIKNILNKKKRNKSFKYEVFEKTLQIIDVDIKGINYLTTALMNNLKKGKCEDFKSNEQPLRLPSGMTQEDFERLPENYQNMIRNRKPGTKLGPIPEFLYKEEEPKERTSDEQAQLEERKAKLRARFSKKEQVADFEETFKNLLFIGKTEGEAREIIENMKQMQKEKVEV